MQDTHAFYLISLVSFFFDVLMLHKHQWYTCTCTLKKQLSLSHAYGRKTSTRMHIQYPGALQLIFTGAGENWA